MSLQDIQKMLKGSNISDQFSATPPETKTGLFPEPAKISKGVGLKQLEAIAAQCPRGNYATGRLLSYSALKDFQYNPYSYIKYCTREEPEETPEYFLIGNLFEDIKSLSHKDISKKWHVSQDFVKPVPSATMAKKENKTAFAEYKEQCQKEAGDRTICTLSQYELAKDMCSVSGGPLLGGETQVAVEFKEPESGLWVRGFMDHLKDHHCTELKSVNDISLAGKRFNGGGFNIWMQCAIYSFHPDVKTVDAQFVSTTHPVMTVTVSLNPEQLERLRERFVKNILYPFTHALEYGFDVVASKIITARV